MNDKPVLSKEYNIPKEMFADAFRDFQKKYSYPKNIIMTAIFLIIAVMYTVSLVRDPSNTVCMMIIVVCIFLTAGIWMNMLVIRKNLMTAVEGIENDIYMAELYESSIAISTSDDPEAEVKESKTEDQEKVPDESEEDDFFAETEEAVLADDPSRTVIDFVNDDVDVLEKKDYFIVYLVKRTFYVIPKQAYTEDELAVLRKSFEKTKFISDNKK